MRVQNRQIQRDKADLVVVRGLGSGVTTNGYEVSFGDEEMF